MRPVVLGALANLREVMCDHIVTDKGHRSHSSGRTIVMFWVKQPSAVETDGRSTIISPQPMQMPLVDEEQSDSNRARDNDDKCERCGTTVPTGESAHTEKV